MRGILNKMGTMTLATCARAWNVPFYVAAESYKFAFRLYPLNQADVQELHHPPPQQPQQQQQQQQWSLALVDTTTGPKDDDDKDDKPRLFPAVELDPSIQVVNPPVDFTPAKFITLLFTDLGVLTPSAVSDELIRLY